MTNPYPFYKQHDSMEIEHFLPFPSKILQKKKLNAPKHLFFMGISNYIVDKERMILCQKCIKFAENDRKLGLKCIFLVKNVKILGGVIFGICIRFFL